MGEGVGCQGKFHLQDGGRPDLTLLTSNLHTNAQTNSNIHIKDTHIHIFALIKYTYIQM